MHHQRTSCRRRSFSIIHEELMKISASFAFLPQGRERDLGSIIQNFGQVPARVALFSARNVGPNVYTLLTHSGTSPR